VKKAVFVVATLFVLLASSSQGINVALSGTNNASNQTIVDFLTANFPEIENVTQGDYSNPANIPAGTDVLMIGRALSSGPYGNVANTATFNALTIPVVCLTSYVARSTGDRWGWHSGGEAGGSVAGDETTVTAAGADVFGAAGTYDWWTTGTGTGFNASGSGTVGDGEILATIGGNILVAHWKAGETSGMGATFGSDRLLFNIPDVDFDGVPVMPDTAAGQEALIAALKLILGQDDDKLPYDPTPEDGEPTAGEVFDLNTADVTLGWMAGIDPNPETGYLVDPAIHGYYIYLRAEEPNMVGVDPYDYTIQAHDDDPAVTDPSNEYGPIRLDRGVTYYWQVEQAYPNPADPDNAYPANDPNNLMGPLWSFTVIPQTVSISTVSPALSAVDAGSDVELSVTAVAAETYQWYKIGDPDEMLTDGDTYSGVTTDTLTISGVQLADEGLYYCVASNPLYDASNRETGPGRVMTKRLIIHYPFDEIIEEGGVSLVEDVVGGYDMVLTNDNPLGTLPSLVEDVPGLVTGKGLFFNNSDIDDPNNAWGQYATAGDVDMEAMGNGLTISFWVKWVGNNGAWQGIINRRGEWAAADMMWRIDKDPTSGAISFEREGDNAGRVAATLVQDDWHHITLTLDTTVTPSRTRMYNNGEQVATATGFTYGTGVDSEFKLGNNNDGSSTDLFWGILSDVKVYNYALTVQEVANEFLAVRTDLPWVCDRDAYGQDSELMELDVNNDCLINLEDFAAYAERWMDDRYQFRRPLP